MVLLVLELNTNEIEEDARYPEGTVAHVQDHLKHFLGKGNLVPAVHVIVEPSGIRIVRGHAYWRAARDLGHSKIRAIIDQRSDPTTVAELRRHRREIAPGEWDEGPLDHATSWHVFFFDPPLSEEAARAFRAMLASCDSRNSMDWVKDLAFDLERGLVEFKAKLLTSDESQLRRLLQACADFSQDTCKIVSYQGRRW